MKQHIAPKQAKEVSEAQFYSLFDKNAVVRIDWANYHHKKITIGKMIEYLSDKTIIYWKADKENYSRVGLVTEDSAVLKDFREKELCDALWEAVKYIMKY